MAAKIKKASKLPLLGKKPKKEDPQGRTIKLARYLRRHLPVVASAVMWAVAVTVDWGQMLNDVKGDCAIAAPGHQIMSWTANTGKLFVPPDAQIGQVYDILSPNDNGCVMLDVLRYWRKNDIAGHKILGFAEVDPQNIMHIQAAIDLFGGIYLGFQLPIATQNQDVWDIPDEGLVSDGTPGSWGGHAVVALGYGVNASWPLKIAGYDQDGVVVISWGQAIRVTWRFIQAYCDEAYVVLSEDWINANGECPVEIKLDELKADIALVGAA